MRSTGGSGASVSRTASVVAFALVGLAHPSHAQTTISVQLSWPQPAPDLASASGYTYRRYDDGATTGMVLTGVTCTGAASPFTCTSGVFAVTTGSHTLQMTAANSTGESIKVPTPPLAYAFTDIPFPPGDVRVIQVILTTVPPPAK